MRALPGLMKTTNFNLLFVLIAVALTASCRRVSAPEKANSNQSATPAQASIQGPETSETPRLVGSYALVEVEHKGTINLIPGSFATTFTFMADGTYTRTSKQNGRTDHTDSGQFRVELEEDGKLQLVLKAMFSRDRPAQNAPEKKHEFTISPDLEELRLIGTDGKVGLFRRIGAPQG